jgi:hypothetical protein
MRQLRFAPKADYDRIQVHRMALEEAESTWRFNPQQNAILIPKS